MTLAAPVLHAYAEHKDALGLLDYDDLIGRTSHLLVDPGAAWVLYKLDGGLDHLLLDEVQDTAPEQWRIAHALTEEFFAGVTARDAQPHRVRRRRPQAVDLFVPGRRRRDDFDRSHRLLARAGRRGGQALAGRDAGRVVPLDRGRCWSWWIGVRQPDRRRRCR